jgi:hypothetical protein
LHRVKLPEQFHNKVLSEIAFGGKIQNLELKRTYIKYIK